MRRASVPVLLALLAAVACGRAVDVGGTQPPAVGARCDPCGVDGDCAPGLVCARIVGNLAYCTHRCSTTSDCTEVDDICVEPSPGARACAPASGICATSPRPDAPIDHCGSMVAPEVQASCAACDDDDPQCQPNGCYGGFWCDTATTLCRRPPVDGTRC